MGVADRAITEKSCRIAVATDRETYLNAFWTAVRTEREFRQKADSQREEIEDELRRTQMAAENLNYNIAAATSANREDGQGGGQANEEAGAAALRYKETVDRLMGIRLEILMSCKLAALLGQTNIFLNNNIPVVDALGMVATALGLGSNPNEAAAGADGPLFGGLEPFMMASNPISEYTRQFESSSTIFWVTLS